MGGGWWVVGGGWWVYGYIGDEIRNNMFSGLMFVVLNQ